MLSESLHFGSDALFLTTMAESYSDSLRRRAVQLVLEKNLTPGQAAKVLQCTIHAVKKWVKEALDQESLPQTEPFVPVTLEETAELSSSPVNAKAVSVEPLPDGYSLRLQLATLSDVIRLLQFLEDDPC